MEAAESWSITRPWRSDVRVRSISWMIAGSVSAVVPFGLFIALDGIFIEGLLHISDLGSDYFHYDETRHALMGERTGKQFRLSDRVKVQLVRVDMATNKIDFRLIEGPLPVAPKAPAQPAEVVPAAAAPAGATERLAAAAPLAVSGAQLVRDLAKPCAPSRITFAIQSRIEILSYCF